MKNLEENLHIQLLALKHIEETYGKNWRKIKLLSSTAIFNAFISGYKAKECEDRTAVKVIYGRKYVDKVEPYRETI